MVATIEESPAPARRVLRVLAASCLLFVVVALGLLATWRWWVPEYRPALRAGETYGLDVSHHQREVDWSAVRNDNIAFVYLKASEGGDHRDRLFNANRKGATAAGLRVGAYHFFTFCRPGADQAANFLAVVAPDQKMLPPAVDLEYGGNCSSRPARDDLRRELQSFLEIVEAAWGKPVLAYVLHDTEADYGTTDYLTGPRWQRKLFRRPKDSSWFLWQVHGHAHVRGVQGPVDLNVGSEDLAA